MLMYGHPRVGSAAKFADSLAIIRALLDSGGAPVWYDGERYSMKGGVLELEPYGDHPPLVLGATGGTADVLALLGRYGDGFMTNLPGMCHGGPEQFARDRGSSGAPPRRPGATPTGCGSRRRCWCS